MNRGLRWLLIACAAFVVWQCSNPAVSDSSGSGSQTVNASVSGYLKDSEGKPDANAPVSLYKENVLLIDSAYKVGTTITDNDGWYQFDKIVPGDYILHGTSKDSSDASVSTISVDSLGTDVVDTVIMDKTGSLGGLINFAIPSNMTAYATVINTPYYYEIDRALGSFSFAALPPDTYAVTITAKTRAAGPYVLLALDTTVVVTSAMATSMDTLKRFEFYNGADTVLLDDFEDGDRWLKDRKWQNTWWWFSGPHEIDTPIVQLRYDTLPGPDGSGYCAWMQVEFDSTVHYAHAGFGCRLARHVFGVHRVFDFSKLKSISFDIKGPALPLSVSISAEEQFMEYAHIYELDALPATWTRVVIDIPTEFQKLSADDQATWNTVSQYAGMLNFLIKRDKDGQPVSGEVQFDNVQLEFQ